MTVRRSTSGSSRPVLEPERDSPRHDSIPHGIPSEPTCGTPEAHAPSERRELADSAASACHAATDVGEALTTSSKAFSIAAVSPGVLAKMMSRTRVRARVATPVVFFHVKIGPNKTVNRLPRRTAYPAW